VGRSYKMGAIVLFTLVLWFIYLENLNVVHVLKEQSVNVLIKTVPSPHLIRPPHQSS
jgi:hypothetical protein